MKEKLAQRFFNAQIQFAEIESEICEAFRSILGENGWEDFSADYYDESIEVEGCGDIILTEDQQRQFKDLGFSRVWIHPSSPRDHKEEKYYYLGDLK